MNTNADRDNLVGQLPLRLRPAATTAACQAGSTAASSDLGLMVWPHPDLVTRSDGTVVRDCIPFIRRCPDLRVLRLMLCALAAAGPTQLQDRCCCCSATMAARLSATFRSNS